MSLTTARLHGIATSTYPARPVAVVRIVVGVAAFVRGLEAIRVFDRLLAREVLNIPWAGWLPEPTTAVVAAVLIGWLVAAGLFTVGSLTRLSGAALALAMALSIALDQQAYANHLYLMIVLVVLIALADPGAALSLDARRRTAAARVPGWPILLMKIQVTVVYAFAALTKLNDDFLGGGLLRGNLGRGVVDVPGWVTESPTVEILAAIVVVTELSIAALLWVPRRRPIAIGLGLLLHVSIPLLLAGPVQLVVFSTEMLAMYLLFLDVEPQARIVVWDNSCEFCAGWKRRLQGLDLLQATTWVGSGSDVERMRQLGVRQEDADRAMQLIHGRKREEGFGAVQEILSITPWTYLVAPFLLLPPIAAVGDRWYRRQAARRTCGVVPSAAETPSPANPR